MLRSPKKTFVIFLLLITAAMPGFALDDDLGGLSNAEEKARLSHEKASSDMIYQSEEWKALYYQNQEIIQLLKQMRDALEVLREHSVVKATEEK